MNCRPCQSDEKEKDQSASRSTGEKCCFHRPNENKLSHRWPTTAGKLQQALLSLSSLIIHPSTFQYVGKRLGGVIWLGLLPEQPYRQTCNHDQRKNKQHQGATFCR